MRVTHNCFGGSCLTSELYYMDSMFSKESEIMKCKRKEKKKKKQSKVKQNETK